LKARKPGYEIFGAGDEIVLTRAAYNMVTLEAEGNPGFLFHVISPLHSIPLLSLIRTSNDFNNDK